MSDTHGYVNDDVVRRITRSFRPPDFIGIGVQKAGTTWLHANLQGHPDIFMSPVKELQYFNEIYIRDHRAWTVTHREDHVRRVLRRYLENKTIADINLSMVAHLAHIAIGPISDEWYGRVFVHARPDQLCGEITPEYALLPRGGIAHVARFNPCVRILLLLRDPIERNWSHIRMLVGLDPKRSRDLRKLADLPDVMGRARYPEIVRKWSKLVPAERFFIGFYDEIGDDPYRFLERLCDFLGIGFHPNLFPNASEIIHVGREAPLPEDLYSHMKEQMAALYDELVDLFPPYGPKWRRRHYG